MEEVGSDDLLHIQTFSLFPQLFQRNVFMFKRMEGRSELFYSDQISKY